MPDAVTEILWIIFALCLIATVIGAFIKYVPIPEPFSWLKGLITFVFIVLACVWLWNQFVSGHIRGARHGDLMLDYVRSVFV